MIEDKDIYALFKNSIISAQTIPDFSFAHSDTRYGDLCYALLKSNENCSQFNEKMEGILLDGYYVGIGFGMSFSILGDYFSSDYKGALLVEREPYVYFLGKILLDLIQKSEHPEQVLLYLVDFESFSSAFTVSMKNEADNSPLFLRESRKELSTTIPEAFLQLRKEVFNLRHNKLTRFETQLFEVDSEYTIADKLDWVRHFMRYKAHYSTRAFVRNYQDIQEKAKKITAICADFFHRDLWKGLAELEDVFKSKSLFYFSNAAVYSAELDLRKEEFSTSQVYSRALVNQLPNANRTFHYYCYAERDTNYFLSHSRVPPTLEDLVQTFQKKSKNKKKVVKQRAVTQSRGSGNIGPFRLKSST